MPLSEFLRMARGKSNQQKPCPNQPSSRADNGLLELVWENGQIVMQDQSSKVNRSHDIQNTPLFIPRNGDPGVLHSKIGRFSEVESMLDDISPIVPSGDLVLTQDDDMIRWLNYPLDDPLPQDYCSDLIPEISGVTANAISTQDGNLSVDKRMNGNLHDGGTSKAAASSYSKPRVECSWRPQQSQTSYALGSGVTDVLTSNNPSNPQSVLFGDSSQGKSDIGDSTSRQGIQKLPTSNTNIVNFSHFSKPVLRAKSDGPNSSVVPNVAPSVCVGNIVVPEKNSLSNAITNSEKPVLKENKELSQVEKRDNICKESCLSNEKPVVKTSEAANSRKEIRDTEKIAEPVVVTSSVGSGNSADRVSYGQTQNSKRKFINVDDSECRSDDFETESAGVKKLNNGRGGNGTKRSRAAEVHNLSERRRRDRINEKMRALQELIPNCNKADKASMLDEAIEYLKTLQLQVQIMSMGAGLCMPPMMYPAPHFPPLMGMGMGYGSHMFQVQRPHFPPLMPGVPSNFPRMPLPCSDIPPGYVNNPSGQGIPGVVIPRPPPPPQALVPLNGGGPHNVSTSHMNLNGEDGVDKNSQLMCNFGPGGSMSRVPNQTQQVTNEGMNDPATVRENEQSAERVHLANNKLASSATEPNKEAGCS